jgi:uncharacterized protein YukE
MLMIDAQSIKQLLDAGAIGIVTLVVLVGAGLLILIVRVFGKAASQNDANQGKLIDILGQMADALNHIKDNRELDNTTRQQLATALHELSDTIKLSQKASNDQQKVVAETLALLQNSVEQFGMTFNVRFDALANDLSQVLAYAEKQPGLHKEVVDLLNTILKAVQTMAKAEVS